MGLDLVMVSMKIITISKHRRRHAEGAGGTLPTSIAISRQADAEYCDTQLATDEDWAAQRASCGLPFPALEENSHSSARNNQSLPGAIKDSPLGTA